MLGFYVNTPSFQARTRYGTVPRGRTPQAGTFRGIGGSAFLSLTIGKEPAMANADRKRIGKGGRGFAQPSMKRFIFPSSTTKRARSWRASGRSRVRRREDGCTVISSGTPISVSTIRPLSAVTA